MATDVQDDDNVTENGKTSKLVKIARKIGGFLLANWLTFGFGLGCLFGYLFPYVAARGGIIKSEYSILYGVVAFIFFVNGMQLDPAKLKEHITNWRLHILVQGIGFIVIPIIQLIVIRIVIAAGAVKSGVIDTSMLIGMVVVSAIPTTIASNVVMTRNAGGDEAACIIEVVIGNVVGSFISPGLIYGFMPSDPEFDDKRPASPATLGPMYGNVMKQLGLSVLLPLVVGQTLRWTWSKKVEWTLRTFRLPKICSLCLVLLVWAVFSGAFQSGAFYKVSKSSIIFNIVMNVVLYIVYTIVCFSAAYPPDSLARPINAHVADSKLGSRLPSIVRRAITVRKVPKVQVVAICLCGAAKTQSLGIPLSEAMWAQHNDLTKSLIEIPVLLYTMEQVFVAQFLTMAFRWWLQRDEKKATHTDQESIDTSQAISGPGVGNNDSVGTNRLDGEQNKTAQGVDRNDLHEKARS